MTLPGQLWEPWVGARFSLGGVVCCEGLRNTQRRAHGAAEKLQCGHVGVGWRHDGKEVAYLSVMAHVVTVASASPRDRILPTKLWYSWHCHTTKYPTTFLSG
jgi:hypothetical protein